MKGEKTQHGFNLKNAHSYFGTEAIFGTFK